MGILCLDIHLIKGFLEVTMFASFRRRPASTVVHLCESCGQVSTPADRARAQFDDARTRLALLHLPR